MTNLEIITTLKTGSFDEIVALNDSAEKIIRVYADNRGYEIVALIRDETARVETALVDYLQAKRVGSTHKLTRSVRRAVWSRRTLLDRVASDACHAMERNCS